MDRELLLRARAGDREAFDLIVVSEGERLFRTALAITGNEADALDATQESLVKSWRSLASLRDVERFDAWLGRILVNGCRKQLRNRRRVAQLSVDRAVDESGSAPIDGFDEAFARLSVDQRTILVLHYVHGYPVGEISAWLGAPSGTVKWRLHRARQVLRQELEAVSRGD
jgi:RNA polymerase sigma-70 factor (ECF subfamily)